MILEILKLKDKETYIYFFQSVDTGRIKIGLSKDPKKRMKQLQTSERLFLLHAIKGTRWLESNLHDRFAHLRIHGEWFEPAQELFDYIEQLQGSEIEIY